MPAHSVLSHMLHYVVPSNIAHSPRLVHDIFLAATNASFDTDGIEALSTQAFKSDIWIASLDRFVVAHMNCCLENDPAFVALVPSESRISGEIDSGTGDSTNSWLHCLCSQNSTCCKVVRLVVQLERPSRPRLVSRFFRRSRAWSWKGCARPMQGRSLPPS